VISLHTAPARLHRAIIEYLWALFMQLRLMARVDEYVAMPEFTAADLLKIAAPVRRADIIAGCFIQRSFMRNSFMPSRRLATIRPWQLPLPLDKARSCNACGKRTCGCSCP